jgi:hypothetical protein
VRRVDTESDVPEEEVPEAFEESVAELLMPCPATAH